MQTPPTANSNLHTKTRTFSLPKLKQPSSSQNSPQPSKVFEELHKVKWSISPKCFLHVGKQVMYICVNPSCQLSTRLVCEDCFFNEHAEHNQCFLAVDQVKNGDVNKLRFWPFDYKYAKIHEFVGKHQSYMQNLVQDINLAFNQMASRILEKVEDVKNGVLKDVQTFYQYETNKKQFVQKLKDGLQKCFDLTHISESVRQIFCKEVRHQVFSLKMNQVLNETTIISQRQNLLKYFETAQKGKDMVFDKKKFILKQQWIVAGINSQNQTVTERPVQVQDTDPNLSRFFTPFIEYMRKNSRDLYPLSFDRKKYDDGSIYEGFFQNGVRAGIGIKTSKNGTFYFGEWRKNLKNGWGISENPNTKSKYQGSWKDDRKSGYGRQVTATYIYQGFYISDKRQGSGSYIQDGNRYEISWKNDKMHGYGKMIDKKGVETQLYYINGVESMVKNNKSTSSSEISELAKRFNQSKAPST